MNIEQSCIELRGLAFYAYHGVLPEERQRGNNFVVDLTIEADISKAIWTCMGYTVLLCFCLFKTSSLAKSVFNAH